MFEITKEFAFEAAHHLPLLPAGHQCARPHGHSYRVIVTLAAEHTDHHGFIRDFGELACIKVDIDAFFDHRDLNVACVGIRATTAELLAEYFFARWWTMVPELVSVTVCETAKTTATYTPTWREDIGRKLSLSDVRRIVLAMGRDA